LSDTHLGDMFNVIRLIDKCRKLLGPPPKSKLYSSKGFIGMISDYHNYNIHVANSFQKLLTQSLSTHKNESCLLANARFEHSVVTMLAMLNQTKEEINLVVTKQRLDLFCENAILTSMSKALTNGVQINILMLGTFERSDIKRLHNIKSHSFKNLKLLRATDKSKDFLVTSDHKNSSYKLSEFETFDNDKFMLWINPIEYAAIGGFNDEVKTTDLKRSFIQACSFGKPYKL